MRKRDEKIVQGKVKWYRTTQMRKIKIIMTVVLTALCISIAAGAILFWIQYKKPLNKNSDSRAVLNSISIDSNVLPEYDNSYNLIVVNASNKIDSKFKIQSSDVGGVTVDSRIVPFLEKMINDASKDGCRLKLLSGYVSCEQQDKLFSEGVKKLISSGNITQVRAENQAQKTIGKGGYNENQTGMAVEFTAENSTEDVDFVSTKEFNWLEKNCVNYGFILRYPKNKTSVTGRDFNSRHFRFVGKNNAVKMRAFSMALEEYASYIRQQTP